MIYPEQIGRCQYGGCGKPATHRLMHSGTDPRGMACAKHVAVVGKGIAQRLGEDYSA